MMRNFLRLVALGWLCASALIVAAAAQSPNQRLLLFGGKHVPGYYNFTGANLPHWAAAQNAVAAGTRNAKIAFIGDSTTAGYGAQASNINDASSSVAAQLTALIQKSSYQSFWADHATAGNNAFDSRLSLGSFSGPYGADVNDVATAGGGMYIATSGSSPLSFTPSTNVDTFVLYYPTNSAASLGSLSVAIDSGTPTVLSQTAGTGTAVATATFSTTLGSHSLNVTPVTSAGPCFIISVVAYNSSSKEYSFYVMGGGGWAVADWNYTTAPSGDNYDPLPTVSYVAPDLTIINLTINDWDAGTSLSSYKTNLQTIINTAKASGDVILLSGNQSEAGVNGAASLQVQAQYVAAVKQLASLNNIPMIDIWSLFGAWASANSKGLMYDNLHPNAAGYGVISRYIAAGLVNGFRSR